MKQKFIAAGYNVIDFYEKADIYVINTCTVTNVADRKSRQIIRRAKEQNSDALIIVTGCYAEVSREELEKMKEIDLIIGNDDKNNIIDVVEAWVGQKRPQRNTELRLVSCNQQSRKFSATTNTDRTRLVIKIQDGCDNFCTYCIVPYAKGRSRSRKIASIVSEIVGAGFHTCPKEVVITGIEIASYDYGLINLLEKINKIEELKRIRLGSLEPRLITKDFLTRLKKLEKICDHFHLSLQSGSNSVLKRMNRKYSTGEFKNKVKMIRELYPEAAITTDIIVRISRRNRRRI